MFIKRTTKRVKGKTYVNHLLVESIATPTGPRHKIICSLGSLEPGPKDQWLTLARKLEATLAGQQTFLPDPHVTPRAATVKTRLATARATPPHPSPTSVAVAVHPDQVEVELAREAGPVHVGHQMWQKLTLGAILGKAGISPRTQRLTELMVLNRLIHPLSEHAMPDWIRRTALGDILQTDVTDLADDALYRTLDRLHPQREVIEKKLAAQEQTLFNLDDQLYLYDLTSTYFEGQCLANPQAKRGYSRDKRPDCKQVVVGLVLGREGFPKAHEVFDGNRTDGTTVEEMLTALEKRVGKKPGATVVVDRGMASAENLKQINAHGYHYLVASHQGERAPYLEAFAARGESADWHEVIREVSPTNPAQKKGTIWIKKCLAGEELHILCVSEGRIEKDRAIREKQEQRFLADVTTLKARIATGRLVKPENIHHAIGRLQERYPRVSRYYAVDYDPATRELTAKEKPDTKAKATTLDGGYILKTDRTDLTAEEIWNTYILLTRVEAAFREMKSPLMEQPIFHQLERRVQTHIFLCVLAYHLLVAIENMFLRRGMHTSWATLREQLSTHQVVTVVLPTSTGKIVKIRKGTTPEKVHQDIYHTLEIPEQIMAPVKTWTKPDSH
ncbi:MAG: IS1634 family transposase [Candidatus Methylomirabilales bacterium]